MAQVAALRGAPGLKRFFSQHVLERPHGHHVIGFKVRGDFFVWGQQAGEEYRHAETVARCLADRTGGHYVSAETAEDLVAKFCKTLGCLLLF